jgi:hypothetical protein
VGCGSGAGAAEVFVCGRRGTSRGWMSSGPARREGRCRLECVRAPMGPKYSSGQLNRRPRSSMWQYFALFAASAAFEFAYVAWARAAATGRMLPTVAYSVTTAALGLAGVGGALTLPSGWIPYLAGIAVGAWSSAYMAGRGRMVPA